MTDREIMDKINMRVYETFIKLYPEDKEYVYISYDGAHIYDDYNTFCMLPTLTNDKRLDMAERLCALKDLFGGHFI